MICLLSRLFIKDWKNYSDKRVRHSYGILTGIAGIGFNILLFFVKIMIGIFSKSVAITADAFNNLSDAASSFVQVLGFKLSLKKADKEHPFGHGRIEYISGLIISFLILLMGFKLLESSVISFFKPAKIDFSILSFFILMSSIFVKFYMYFYNHRIAKKIDSLTLEAAAKDSLSDCLSTAIVIISGIFGRFTDFPLDSIAGFIVSFFIIYEGFKSAKETAQPLLGTPPTKEFVKQIEEEVLKHKPIYSMHDLIVHNYGPGRLIISLHAEVPGDVNIFELHDVIDNTENDLNKKFNCQAVIHMDPIDTHNKRLKEIKNFLLLNISKIYQGLNIHDVRLVPGKTHSNLIFEVVKPFNCEIPNKILNEKIKDLLKKQYSDVNCVISFESPFVQ
ncbi:cation diffusion facilitator family transporter [Treponema pectinovorum]|uniref:cation diffusion facilitator family transporter n=1 Tax=Treponema pectinovorum TaxID=164 RepID=UPI0011C91EAF|nr:cation diffusion facilitator family transporter [Treponema pectinovorum]